MPNEADLSANERQFILEALDEGLRLDGRGLTDFRSIEITYGDVYGNVTVGLGSTR